MFSDNFRLADPEYIDFVPKTVQEAILKFRRLQAKGLEAWMFPEALIKCGAELPEEEATKFENWMINPTGEPDKNAVDVRDFMRFWTRSTGGSQSPGSSCLPAKKKMKRLPRN